MSRDQITTIYCWVFFSLWISSSLFAQSNHTILAGDATNDFTNIENLGTESGRSCYLTWDATNLYIGVESNPLVNTFSNLWVIIDLDPATNDDPRSGNGRSDQPTNEAGGATYPFNADVIYKFNGSSSDDGSLQDPADGDKWLVSGGNWVSFPILANTKIRRETNQITDIVIPFSDAGINLNADFNIIIYLANNGSSGTDNNFAQWPTNNPDGHALTDGNSNPMTHYYTFTRMSTVQPNANKHLSIRTYATGFSFGESELANLALIGGNETYSAGALTAIHKNLYNGANVTFTMNTNTTALTISENLTNIGNLTLSSNTGGDLNLGGNWNNSGTFTHNNRQVTFNGTADQTITNTNGETFSYLEINKISNNLILENDIEITNRLLFGNDNIATITTTNTNKITLSNDVADDANNGIVRNGTGMIATTLVRNIGTSTGNRLFPMGDGTNYRALTLEPTSAPITGGTVTLNYTTNSTVNNVSIADNLFTIILQNQSSWAMTTATLAGGTYNLKLQGDDMAVDDVTHLHLCLSGSVVGTHSTGTGTTSEPEANRTALTLAELSNTFYIGSANSLTLLPVEWLSFTAKPVHQNILLEWSTTLEENNQVFIIEKSNNGQHFEKIGEIAAKSNNSTFNDYQFWDDQPFINKNYYRLKQVDFDGKYQYSNIISIQYQTEQNSYVYPNPVRDILNINTTEKVNWITIYNTFGQLVAQYDFQKNINLSNLECGIYFLNLLDHNQKILYTTQLIKF